MRKILDGRGISKVWLIDGILEYFMGHLKYDTSIIPV